VAAAGVGVGESGSGGGRGVLVGRRGRYHEGGDGRVGDLGLPEIFFWEGEVGSVFGGGDGAVGAGVETVGAGSGSRVAVVQS
jgi:hypothetical protein